MPRAAICASAIDELLQKQIAIVALNYRTPYTFLNSLISWYVRHRYSFIHKHHPNCYIQEQQWVTLSCKRAQSDSQRPFSSRAGVYDVLLVILTHLAVYAQAMASEFGFEIVQPKDLAHTRMVRMLSCFLIVCSVSVLILM
jgi:hypothetical protein